MSPNTIRDRPKFTWQLHTLKAQKLDRKYVMALRRGELTRAAELRHKAGKAARKGGWF